MSVMPNEKYFDPADQYAHHESGPSAQSQIESMSNFAADGAKQVQLEAVLAGEGDFLDRVLEMNDPVKQLVLARGILQSAAVVGRLIPDHIIESNRPAFIVAFAFQLNERKKNLN